MDKLVKYIFSLWTRFRLVFSFLKLDVRHGRVFGIRLRGHGKNNAVLAAGKDISFAQFEFSGSGNQVRNFGRIDRCRIVFEGNDNILELQTGTALHYSTIFLRGDHNRITIGKNTDINGMTAVCQGQNNLISIGEDCLFSSDIDLWASDTHTIFDENGTVCNHSRPIHIGDHVWLGKGVAVLKGCSIGDGTVVGMRSLVTRDLPDRVIAVGNPAKVIRSGITWDKKEIDVN